MAIDAARKRELNRAYVARNRERLRVYQREWVAKNHAKKLAYQKAHRERQTDADRAKAREYARSYRAKNRETVNAKERARKKGLSQVARRAYFREYARSHKLTPLQMERRRIAQRRWRALNLEAINKKRRLVSAGGRREETYIPETTVRMEVEQEMWLARLEGRDPQEAKRAWFTKEKTWAIKTRLLRTPFEDGPLYEERKSA